MYSLINIHGNYNNMYMYRHVTWHSTVSDIIQNKYANKIFKSYSAMQLLESFEALHVMGI